MTNKISIVFLITMLFGSADYVAAHCEVPCGIYADQRRFESMLEDQATIVKAMEQIQLLAEKDDAQSHNQLARWVSTKEVHATTTQQVIAQYFMIQRIKPTSSDYVKQLTTAHVVMVAAMKCKQNVDAIHAEALKKAIVAFHAAYEGK